MCVHMIRIIYVLGVIAALKKLEDGICVQIGKSRKSLKMLKKEEPKKIKMTNLGIMYKLKKAVSKI